MAEFIVFSSFYFVRIYRLYIFAARFTKFYLMATRGIRNNNPANIRHGSKWQGLSPAQPDTSFCTFVSMEYGVRALICLLRTYYKTYNLRSIRSIISRYAPPSENDTDSYIRFVSSAFECFSSEDLIPLSFAPSSDYLDNLYLLASRICFLESGYNLTRSMFYDVINNYV